MFLVMIDGRRIRMAAATKWWNNPSICLCIWLISLNIKIKYKGVSSKIHKLCQILINSRWTPRQNFILNYIISGIFVDCLDSAVASGLSNKILIVWKTIWFNLICPVTTTHLVVTLFHALVSRPSHTHVWLPHWVLVCYKRISLLT